MDTSNLTKPSFDAITFGSLKLMIGDVMALVTALEIHEVPNRHGSMAVTVMVQEQEKDYILYEGDGSVSLFYNQDGKLKPLFQGIVIRMEVTAEGETYFISLEVNTDSYMMDIHSYNRSFQDIGMSSHQLVQLILTFYQGSQALIAIPDQPIGQIVVQYQETSWEFLKRFVSAYGACLYVDSASLGIRLRIGPQDLKEQVKWDHLSYTVKRNIAPKDVDKQLKHQVVYLVEAYDVLPLGAQVQFHNQNLYIGNIYRYIKEGLLINQYQLLFKEGLTIKKYHNPLISGISVNGSVTSIQRNKVQVQLETDVLPVWQNQYCFPFSTVAASPDGSGWYCMPKAGDPVRIFFPVSDEKEGYAITNIKGQPSPSQDSPMGNPDTKNIMTPDGKTVTFIANGILMSVGDGKGSVTLTNDGKAEIKSEEDIEICAAEELYITADGSLHISAGVKIEITSDEGSSIRITEEHVEVNATIIGNN